MRRVDFLLILGVLAFQWGLISCEKRLLEVQKNRNLAEIDYGLFTTKYGIEAAVYAAHDGEGKVSVQRAEGIETTARFLTDSLQNRNHGIFFNVNGNNRVGPEPEGLIIFGSNLRFNGPSNSTATTHTFPVVDGEFLFEADGSSMSVDVEKLQNAVEKATFAPDADDLLL